MGSSEVGAVVEGLAASESGNLLPEMEKARGAEERGEVLRRPLPADQESWADLGLPSAYLPLPAELPKSSFLLPGLDQTKTASVFALEELNVLSGEAQPAEDTPIQPSTGSIFVLDELNITA